jgi:hypothetical protein
VLRRRHDDAVAAAVQETARSKIDPGLRRFYAIGNVLLALWGSVIVVLVH